ncbi:group-specific protein [Bacillus cereus]|nr:group-specific protein [Bacillus cereus]
MKYICIGGEKMSLLFDVIADIILFYPRNDMKLKHHIAKLSVI